MDMPHDHEAEGALLGSVILNPRMVEHLDPAAMFDDKHRTIAEVMRALHDRQVAIDTRTVASELRERGDLEAVGGVLGLIGYPSLTPSADNAEHYAAIVRRMAQRRAIIESASLAIAGAQSLDVDPGEVIAKHEASLLGLREQRQGRGLRRMGDAVGTAFVRLESLSEHKQAVTGVPTGLLQLDSMTAGLQPTDVIVIAGRPSSGKTSTAMGIVQHAAIVERRISAVFSLEMSAEQLALRMLSSEGYIEGAKLRVGQIYEEDWPKLARAAAAISEAPIFVDDTGGISVGQIRAELRRLVAREGRVDLVVVDYLQLMGSPNPKLGPEQVVSENSRALKAIAKEFSCPVIVLSQLNRELEKRQDKRPILSDLRSSGSIEQDADVVVFVYRDVVYNPETEHPRVAELIIGKQRNGPLGTARVAFRSEYTRFENLGPDDMVTGESGGEAGGGW